MARKGAEGDAYGPAVTPLPEGPWQGESLPCPAPPPRSRLSAPRCSPRRAERVSLPVAPRASPRPAAPRRAGAGAGVSTATLGFRAAFTRAWDAQEFELKCSNQSYPGKQINTEKRVAGERNQSIPRGQTLCAGRRFRALCPLRGAGGLGQWRRGSAGPETPAGAPGPRPGLGSAPGPRLCLCAAPVLPWAQAARRPAQRPGRTGPFAKLRSRAICRLHWACPREFTPRSARRWAAPAPTAEPRYLDIRRSIENTRKCKFITPLQHRKQELAEICFG